MCVGVWVCACVSSLNLALTLTLNHARRTSQEVSRQSQSMDNLGGYRLFDLVQLTAGAVGVVVRVGREAVEVLGSDGKVIRATLSELMQRLNRPAQRNAALDANKQRMSAGDRVRVKEGKQGAGRMGTVKWIHGGHNMAAGGTVFIHSPEYRENNGMLAAPARGVALVGRNRATEVRNDALKNASKGKGGGALGGRLGFRSKRGKKFLGSDSFVGKLVKIRRGMQKGHLGDVRDENEDMLRVELHARHKTITVKKSDVKVVDERGNAVSAGAGGGGGGSSSGSGIGMGIGIGGMMAGASGMAGMAGIGAMGMAGVGGSGGGGSGMTPAQRRRGNVTPAIWGGDKYSGATPSHVSGRSRPSPLLFSSLLLLFSNGNLTYSHPYLPSHRIASHRITRRAAVARRSVADRPQVALADRRLAEACPRARRPCGMLQTRWASLLRQGRANSKSSSSSSSRGRRRAARSILSPSLPIPLRLSSSSNSSSSDSCRRLQHRKRQQRRRGDARRRQRPQLRRCPHKTSRGEARSG